MRLTESASLGAEIPSTKRRSASHHVRLHSNRYIVIDFARWIRYTEVDGTSFACSKAVLNSLPIRVLVDAKSWGAENKSKFHQPFIATKYKDDPDLGLQKKELRVLRVRDEVPRRQQKVRFPKSRLAPAG